MYLPSNNWIPAQKYLKLHATSVDHRVKSQAGADIYVLDANYHI